MGAYVIQFAPLCHLLEALSPKFRGQLCCPLVCKLAGRVARVSKVWRLRLSDFASIVGNCTKLAEYGRLHYCSVHSCGMVCLF